MFFIHVFRCFFMKVKNMVFYVFFISKLMFLTFIISSDRIHCRTVSYRMLVCTDVGDRQVLDMVGRRGGASWPG